MASVSSGILGDANLMNLKEMSVTQVRPEVNSLLVSDEEIIQCFKTIRGQVIFFTSDVTPKQIAPVTNIEIVSIFISKYPKRALRSII